jgi:thioester reductase-like protein
MFEDDFNPSMEGLDFGYPQSKWVAEQLVVGASALGLDVRIYRPAFITASRHGHYVREDVLVRVFSYMIRHGLSVDAANQLSMVPVDVCAQNVVALAELDDPGARVFHLTADNYCTMQMACECITERYGYEFEYVGISELVDQMKRRCGPDDILFPLVAFVRTNSRKIASMGGKRYDSRNYRTARAKSTRTIPEPALADSVGWIVEFLRRHHLIPPVAGRLASA